MYHRTAAVIVSPPEELVLFAGVSMGFADPTAPYARIDRAPLGETLTFLDDGAGGAPPGRHAASRTRLAARRNVAVRWTPRAGAFRALRPPPALTVLYM
ncbi:hypothetical protein [Streptomyces sp. NPDC001851]|uniref:hypothetical protein n=1 Tax=Streptomyces sp. NPDC001851 TaxID=3154529 RepID=UPI00332CA594